MMNESQSRPHKPEYKTNISLIELSTIDDLLRLIRISHKKMGYEYPILKFFAFKKKCIYWIKTVDKKSKTLIFAESKCVSKENFFGLYDPLKSNSFKVVKEDIGSPISENTITFIKAREKFIALLLKSHGKYQTYNPKILCENEMHHHKDLIRIAAYYRLPIFVVENKEKLTLMLGLVPTLSEPVADGYLVRAICNDIEKNYLDTTKGKFVVYIWGEDNIGEGFRFTDKIKLFDVFSPLIWVKKVWSVPNMR